MATEAVSQTPYKDQVGREIKVGSMVLIPFRVTKFAGAAAPLLQLESLEAYGHENPSAQGPLKGRTRTGIWVEPGQIKLSDSS